MKKFLKNLRDMNVSKRMRISFGVVTALSTVGAIFAMIMLWRIDVRYTEAMEKNGFIQGDIGHYTTYLNEVPLKRKVEVKDEEEKNNSN